MEISSSIKNRGGWFQERSSANRAQKPPLNREYQRQHQLLDRKMKAVKIACKTGRSSRRDDAYRPLSKENEWCNEID